MDKDKIIQFRLASIDELSFEKLWDAKLPEGIDGQKLQVRFFTQTFVNVFQNSIKIKGGVLYLLDEKSLFKLETIFKFNVDDLDSVATIDQENHKINFRNEIINTMLSSVIGALRGMLYVKTLDTKLSKYPLPLIPMDIIIKNNSFVVESSDDKE